MYINHPTKLSQIANYHFLRIFQGWREATSPRCFHLFPYYWLYCIGEHFLRKLYFFQPPVLPPWGRAELRNERKFFFLGNHLPPPWESKIRNLKFLRKLNFLGSSSGQLFPLGEWWPRGWSCSPSNKFRAEFSGAYKWQDTAPPFPQPGLLESRGKVQIIQT